MSELVKTLERALELVNEIIKVTEKALAALPPSTKKPSILQKRVALHGYLVAALYSLRDWLVPLVELARGGDSSVFSPADYPDLERVRDAFRSSFAQHEAQLAEEIFDLASKLDRIHQPDYEAARPHIPKLLGSRFQLRVVELQTALRDAAEPLQFPRMLDDRR